MMMNPGEQLPMRQFQDTISNILEKKQITSQRSQTTLEQSEYWPVKSLMEVDRRCAVTASLKQRIKINKELTESIRKPTRNAKKPDVLSERRAGVTLKSDLLSDNARVSSPSWDQSSALAFKSLAV